MSRSLNALKIENRKKISKANRSITAYADQLAKRQKKVQASMKSMMSSLTGKIRSTSRKNMAAIRAANAKSARGFRSVSMKIRRAISKANEKTNKRFSKLFLAMSKQRRKQNQALNRGVININQARAEAPRQVRAARKSFATRLTTTTSAIKSQENRLLGEVKLVSEELTNHKVAQSRINRRTAAEMKRITKLVNRRNSQSVRARGKLRALLDANKKAAAEEVKALNGLFTRKLP